MAEGPPRRRPARRRPAADDDGRPRRRGGPGTARPDAEDTAPAAGREGEAPRRRPAGGGRSNGEAPRRRPAGDGAPARRRASRSEEEEPAPRPRRRRATAPEADRPPPEPVEEEPLEDSFDDEPDDEIEVEDPDEDEPEDELDDEPADAAQEDDAPEEDDAEVREPEPEVEEEPPRPKRMGARAVARAAVEQIVEMTGKTPEGVTSVSRNDDGWLVGVEVVETERIPNSADVLAIYDAELDDEGELMSYRRVRRYTRGRGDDE